MIINWLTNIIAVALVLLALIVISHLSQLQFIWVLCLLMFVVSIADTLILAFKHNPLWKKRAIGVGITSVIFGLANYIAFK